MMQHQNNQTHQKNNTSGEEVITHTLNPVAWADALSLAHRYCRTIDRKGGTPEQAVASYGIVDIDVLLNNWDDATQIIALSICKPAHQRPC